MSSIKRAGLLAAVVLAWLVAYSAADEIQIGAKAAATAPSEIKLFRFGPQAIAAVDSPLVKGWKAVSVADDFSQEKGYGWVGASGEVAKGWLETRGALNSKTRRGPNDMLASWVAGGLPFAVSLPNGKYIVTTSLGDWGEFEFIDYTSFALSYQGKEVYKCVRTKDNFDQWYYVNKYVDYEPTLNLYDRYVKSRFTQVTQEVEITDGKLTVQSKSALPEPRYVGAINFIAISPVSLKDAHEKLLAGLETGMRADFDKKYPLAAVNRGSVDGMTAEEKQLRFAVGDPRGDRVNTNFSINQRNRLARLTGYAAQGEFEAVSFAIVPTADIGPMTVTCSELEGPGGAKISAENIKVGYVKFWDVQDRGKNVVNVEPYLLMDTNTLPRQYNRIAREWRVTIHVPENVPGGAYQGTVAVMGDAGEMKLPLTFHVLPIKLDALAVNVLLNYDTPGEALFYGDKEARWQRIAKELQMMRDHGMNNVAVGGLHLPISDDDVSDFERFIDLYQKTGFDKPMYVAGTMNMYAQFKNLLDPKQQEAYCEVLRKIADVAARKKQKVIFSLGDECTNDGREAMTQLVAKLVHERMPDLYTISDINGYRELMGAAPYLKAAGFNNGWQGGFSSNRTGHDLLVETVIQRVKSKGCTPWFINGSVGRYPFGVFLWKMQSLGVAGKCEWHFFSCTSDPYNPFDSNQPNAFSSLTFPECIPTMQLEACREGIDDLKYVLTLERVLAEQKDADPVMAGRAAAARDALDYWMDQIPDRLYSAHTPDGAGQHTGKDFPPERLAQFRQEVAFHLSRLLKLPASDVCPAQALLAGFEGENNGFSNKIKIVQEHATEGKSSGQMTFAGGKGFFDNWGRMLTKDWRGYASLRFDVFNPQDKPVPLELVLRDQLASNVSDQVSARKTILAELKSGPNQVVVNLRGITDDSGKRPLDLSFVFNAFFGLKDVTEDTTLYIDNIRLVQDE